MSHSEDCANTMGNCRICRMEQDDYEFGPYCSDCDGRHFGACEDTVVSLSESSTLASRCPSIVVSSDESVSERYADQEADEALDVLAGAAQS